MKKIRKATGRIIPAAAVFIAFMMFVFRVRIFLVMSGSMEPEIRTGSFVFVRELRRTPGSQSEKEEGRTAEQAGKKRVGDIVAYGRNGMIVLHRVTEIRDDGRYVTKGDANRAPDAGTVGDEDIFGKYLFSIGLLSWQDQNKR